jgi:hypothetical protein
VSDFAIKQHDEIPPLSGTITDSSGNPVDLSSSSVRLNMRATRGTDLVVDGDEVTIDQQDLELFPASKGTWHYDLNLSDLEGDTGYLFELIVTDTNGDERTFPTNDFYKLAVYARLVVDAS